MSQHQDQNFMCKQHPLHSYKAIHYGEICSHKTRFLCVQCIIIANPRDNLICFQDFFQDPIGVLDQNSKYFKFTQDNVSANVFKIIEIIDSIETQINQLHQNFIDQLRNLKQEYQNISNISKEQLAEKIKIKEFQQQLDLVWNMDEYQGTEEFNLLEKQLNDIIVNWKNISKQYINETTNNQQKINNLTMKLIDYRDLFTQQQQLLFVQQQIPIQYLNLLWRGQVVDLFIIKEISKGKQIEQQLLYQGTRDGLTNANYWQKCDLLTIITLKNENIFGGYSPCQLNKAQDGWVADSTGSSFIFQQNKKEIYKLKQKDGSIHFNKGNGIYFGSGNDFYVKDDFKTLYSNLGYSYDISGYNVQNNRTHLFGDIDTEVIECKVYKITFL